MDHTEAALLAAAAYSWSCREWRFSVWLSSSLIELILDQGSFWYVWHWSGITFVITLNLVQVNKMSVTYCNVQTQPLALKTFSDVLIQIWLLAVLSVWEIIGQADGGLSVLRTFRLLRVLKLVRFLPALRRQLVVLMKTMDNVATFCMLLMLFIFTFR